MAVQEASSGLLRRKTKELAKIVAKRQWLKVAEKDIRAIPG